MNLNYRNTFIKIIKLIFKIFFEDIYSYKIYVKLLFHFLLKN